MKLIIIGASEPGYEILDIIKESLLPDAEFLGFFDEIKMGENIYNEISKIPKDSLFVSSIGNVTIREKLFNTFIQNKLSPVTIISKHSWRSSSSILGEGDIIYPYVNVSFKTIIGDNVLINYKASISHGVKIGNHSNICPGAMIAGNVTIGNNCFIGIGSVIREKLSICDNTFIGAGAVVVKNIDYPGVYAGNPARLIVQEK